MTNLISAIAFVLAVNSASQEKNADLLIESIRTFGGKYADAPVYVVVRDTMANPYTLLKSKYKVIIRQLKLKQNIDYYFADKVYASAQIEEEVESKTQFLVWLDNEVLVFKEPSQLVLKKSKQVGIRPVFLHNGIALDAHSKSNAYWNGIFSKTRLKLENIPIVETVIDVKKIYAYYNSQVVSVDPKACVFREWANKFDEVLADKAYMDSAFTSKWQHFFLHQAILSAVIISKIPQKNIEILPITYNYSLNQHLKLSNDNKSKPINEITIAVHELTLGNHPDWVELYEVKPPLKDWLNDKIPNLFKISDRILYESSKCNSYMINTSNGWVLVDPGGTSEPTSWLAYHFKNIKPIAIIITHAHSDHLAGLAKWQSSKGIPVYIQKDALGFLNDENDLSSFYGNRASIQGNVPPKISIDWNAVKLFNEHDTLNFGDLQFIVSHTPAETPDAISIYIPQLNTAICGDSFYTSFPNIGAPRGSVPRLAKGYINAMNTILSYNPELLLSGHSEPLKGKENIKKRVTNYRNAIQYVLSKTFEGMNKGIDAITLMNNVLLPDSFGVEEFYGKVSWSIRGIYDYFSGWFDGTIEGLFPVSADVTYPMLIKIAGSSKAYIDEAQKQIVLGNFKSVLILTRIVLTSEMDNKEALKLRIEALNGLIKNNSNYIELQWIINEKKRMSDRLSSIKQ